MLANTKSNESALQTHHVDVPVKRKNVRHEHIAKQCEHEEKHEGKTNVDGIGGDRQVRIEYVKYTYTRGTGSILKIPTRHHVAYHHPKAIWAPPALEM
jgi:hypothetical protein